MSSTGFSIRQYLREMRFPFCPGCGDYTIASTFLQAVHELGYEDLRKFVFCSGIGCASWIPSPYFKADSIHVTHGRSIPVALGVKLMRPDLNVVVFGGDGDLVGIGLSHLIHAARRNLDVAVIMSNNMIYGMTGAQVAPTTPISTKTSTTPYGSFERPIDAAHIVAAAGANYSARWTTHHVRPLEEAVKTALQIKGFAFVEVVSQCPTAFGRQVGLKTSRDLLDWFQGNSVTIKDAERMPEEQLKGKIVVGEFAKRSAPGLVKNIQTILKEAREAAS